MFTHRRQLVRTATKAAQSVFRTVLLVSVSVSLWQAPVPWLHHHRHDEEALAEPQLALHLLSMHKVANHCPDNWHWHFVMLADIIRGSGLPVPAGEGDAPVLPKEHVVPDKCLTSDVSADCAAPLVVLNSLFATPLTPIVCSESLSRLQFLGDSANSLRLHLVLCVARC